LNGFPTTGQAHALSAIHRRAGRGDVTIGTAATPPFPVEIILVKYRFLANLVDNADEAAPSERLQKFSAFLERQ
jgi:hypothetical protein